MVFLDSNRVPLPACPGAGPGWVAPSGAQLASCGLRPARPTCSLAFLQHSRTKQLLGRPQVFKKDSKISHLFSGGSAGYLATFLLTKCWHGRAAVARGCTPARGGRPGSHASTPGCARRHRTAVTLRGLTEALGPGPVMRQRLQLPPCPRDLLRPPPLEPRSRPAQCLSPEDSAGRF